jgi:hypothetical protein
MADRVARGASERTDRTSIPSDQENRETGDVNSCDVLRFRRSGLTSCYIPCMVQHEYFSRNPRDLYHGRFLHGGFRNMELSISSRVVLLPRLSSSGLL